jgi:hypothetical protein
MIKEKMSIRDMIEIMFVIEDKNQYFGDELFSGDLWSHRERFIVEDRNETRYSLLSSDWHRPIAREGPS